MIAHLAGEAGRRRIPLPDTVEPEHSEQQTNANAIGRQQTRHR